MTSKSSRLSVAMPNVFVLASLYVLEFSALLTCMALYKKSDKPLLTFLETKAGVVLVIAVLGLVISALTIVYVLRKAARPQAKDLYATLFLNLWSVIVIVVTAEVLIRVFATSTPAGPVFANTVLFPRSWESFTAHNRAILAKASTWGSYFVYDKILGWTVGRSRRSQDNLYFSSMEGIRSRRVDVTFRNTASKRRIAIVGDSFTFGLEVHYEQTWGYRLELALGPKYQVLNFGVDGYGVDQAFLRYQRDVLSWRPDIVILGIINDDLRRTMGVYGFLTFPGSEMPFPKPRFVIKGGALSLLNLPLPTPDFIFAKSVITELPFIDYDVSFQRPEWESRFYHYAYSIRFLLSRFPRWPVPGPTVSDEAMKSVNGELLRSFVRLAHEQESSPIVVYFPSRSDFGLDGTPQAGLSRVAKEVLRENGIAYLDMTDCVRQVNPAERFLKIHYSPATNAAVARCLREAIRETLQ